jgi:uncharacterized OB-fold protein
VDGYPELDGFLDGCAAGELRIPRCHDCGRFSWPPRPRCRHCHSARLGPAAVSGAAQVYSWVVVHRTRLPGFAGLTPYPVVIAALAEDPQTRLVARFTGPAMELRIGLPVRAAFGPPPPGLPAASFPAASFPVASFPMAGPSALGPPAPGLPADGAALTNNPAAGAALTDAPVDDTFANASVLTWTVAG